MKCPHCRRDRTEVYNSRVTKFGTQIWRRRRCLNCGKSFTTYETSDLSFLKITRPSHRLEPYSRAKLFASLYDAFAAADHPAATIDAVTATIEAKILDLERSEVATHQIAAITLTTLKHFDTAAFLRYLSSHAGLTPHTNLQKTLRQY
jgi:transcriptional repressor NrdR